jgi:hypothetical protein
MNRLAWTQLQKGYSTCLTQIDWVNRMMGDDWLLSECCNLLQITAQFEARLLQNNIHSANDCQNKQTVAFHGPALKRAEEHDMCRQINSQSAR